jgi:tRNA A-37 threonylcarbamoyl transferase component Bud32
MIERAATECWHCKAAILASAQVVGDDSAGGAPTVPFGDTHTWTRGQRAMIGREIIGQYVIVDKLGEGGMGEVYLADQPAIGRQVAIKIVHPQTRERDHDEHVARFRNEAKAAASLESPHIVQIFNWGELEDGTLFMAMEYLPGRTLAQLLDERGGVIEPELAVAIAEQICAALGEAHGAGIVHRDLKPSNIMLIERGEQANFAKVLDFGVAKLEGSDITRSGAMFGTPQYMSPEQLRGDGLDGRSDLYSLGVMLYELLAGKLPFSSPTAVGFVTAHLHEQPPALPPHVPRALAEVVMLLLAKHADERPANAAAVVSELRAALGGRSPAARKRARRRAARRSLIIATVLLSLVAVGVGGWRLWQWRIDTAQALARERARTEQLERKVEETEAAAAAAREQARAAAAKHRQTSSEVREQREQVQSSKARKPKQLDAQQRSLLTRTRAQLEAELREVFEERRIPPSEAEEVWKTHATRVAALEAGELNEAELREQLVSLIALYRKSFEAKRPGERLPLNRLEQLFLAMRTKTELDQEQRRAMLEAVYDEVDGDPSLPELDREYYKRLAVAALVREHGADAEATEQIDAPKPKPEPTPDENEPAPGDPGVLPPADDTAALPSPPPPLPSINAD